MFLELGEAVATCSDSNARCFPCWFSPDAAAPAPLVLARPESQIREMMLLKIKPNVILLLGYFKARSIPTLVRGAVAGPAVLAREGALLGVVGGRADTAGERRGPTVIPERFRVWNQALGHLQQVWVLPSFTSPQVHSADTVTATIKIN